MTEENLTEHPIPHRTREDWLRAATDALRPHFASARLTIPAEVRVSCGLPSRGAFSDKGRNIGQSFSSDATTDGSRQVFISPTLHLPAEVLACLTHELVHAVDDCEHKHGPEFRKLAHSVGLTGKATATVAGPTLVAVLESIASTLGPYPHAGFDPKKITKPQTTRLRKVGCACGYLARITKRWTEVGLPTCPCGKLMSDMTEEESHEEATATK